MGLLLTRWIIHADMDAFFASVEQYRNHPELIGRPVCVGHDPKNGYGRGVVRAASYEARAKGIRSGMPVSQAYRLCPEAVFVQGSFEDYVIASGEFMEVLREFADGDRVRRASIDEAYIEVTERVDRYDNVESLARELQNAIDRRTGLPCSIGAAPNMSVAKVATGMHKPRGITVVGPNPHDIEKFLEPLPVRAINGVGPKTAERLASYGIETLGQIQRMSINELWPIMGRSSHWLLSRARGIDERPLIDNGPRVRKSISKDRTFMEDIDPDDVPYLYDALSQMCRRIGEKLTKKSLRFRTVTVKIRYSDYTTVQRSKSIPVESDDSTTIEKIAKSIFDRDRDSKKPIRLLGIKVSGLREASEQTCLAEFL
ncbi:MAG: DNA polymerase IV [Candidatus Thorarchaeota archaeon]|nr:DNA polymerase IV [Candidatus Thorarchaeota archaeon]